MRRPPQVGQLLYRSTGVAQTKPAHACGLTPARTLALHSKIVVISTEREHNASRFASEVHLHVAWATCTSSRERPYSSLQAPSAAWDGVYMLSRSSHSVWRHHLLRYTLG